jgi:hypothetical protein
LKAVVASGTFLPSLFRERASVPSKANASKPRTLEDFDLRRFAE